MRLEIENTTFSNCYSSYGYLFEITNSNTEAYDRKISIKDSSFNYICSVFHGNENRFIISNSLFSNILKINSLPSLSDSKYSTFDISDTTFDDIILSSELFGEESQYTLNNIILNNIRINSKAIIYSFCTNLYINNLEAKNIKCIGDSGDTSFILFDSGEAENSFEIKNVIIKDSVSNGSFIKIIGNSNIVNISNSTVSNIKSYGPIIDNTSIKSKVTIENLNFNNNFNSNKFECGNIHFKNDVNLSVLNSNFTSNQCKSNGGVICFDDISKINANLTSNVFQKNKATNGGTIYLIDKVIENKVKMKNENENTNINTDHNVYMNNNTLKYNKADNFGGAIYYELNHEYSFKIENNEVLFNEAGILGGGVYSANSLNKFLFKGRVYQIRNNTVNSYLNNFSTKPSYIKLNTEIPNNTINLITGEYLSLHFTIYDGYNTVVEDITRYFSSLTLKIVLEETNKTNEDAIYALKGNTGTFTKGITSMCK
ncbi:hypothetical protein LY90DRAFT_10045 [Neocallimastix californiae]|uniref:Right handed beta helix domain-containing protein n=1 Tax=Neocallimastix californiae TaxID=1754190 RepID=A0A1Y2CKM1_9FUNG|nr:hypothetical protein LY90DRAFT_10045 [Neocallimastix californiae]|eukprot:ORY47563.1 hypothetical protein LY90DRAFT_10045 [Neocallimastix californiae]